MATPAKTSSKVIYPTSSSGYDVYAPEIGRGGFSWVYQSSVKKTGERVAVKVITLEDVGSQLEELRKEIMIMRQLKHDNVVDVLTSFVDGTRLWIVMPLLLGGSAAAIIKTLYPSGFKDETILAAILKETLKGLEYFHKDKLVHRDIKAGNILISQKGEIKLADFGVAGLLNDGNAEGTRRTFTGTICWMAPEVMEQTTGYGTAADIWSFGITAMELAFGSAPYAKLTPMKALLMTISEPSPTFSTYDDNSTKFSSNFKSMVAACLAKDPKKRPTAKDLMKKKFFNSACGAAQIRDKLLKGVPDLQMGSIKKDFTIEDEEGEALQGPSSWVFDVDVKTIQEAALKGKAHMMTPVEETAGAEGLKDKENQSNQSGETHGRYTCADDSDEEKEVEKKTTEEKKEDGAAATGTKPSRFVEEDD